MKIGTNIRLYRLDLHSEPTPIFDCKFDLIALDLSYDLAT